MLTRRTSDNDYLLSSPNGSKEAYNYMLDEYPLPKCKQSVTPEQIKKIGRLIWYCNASGILIPSLNKIIGLEVNSEDYFYDDGDDESVDDESGDDESVDDLGPYRVYPCGHAFYDDMLHEFIYSTSLSSYGGSRNGSFRANIRLLKFVKALEKTWWYCPLCYNQTFTFSNVIQSERINMYSTDPGQGGTIVSARLIPKKYLTYISQEFKEGDIVDTEGYRGLGLYIFNGIRFESVPRDEYYPIWDLYYLKLRGYHYYLTAFKIYDELKFENGISFNPDNGFYQMIRCTVMLDDDDISSVCSANDSGCNANEVPYPFESSKQANTYVHSSTRVKAKISDHDWLFLGKNQAYITNLDGSILCNLYN